VLLDSRLEPQKADLEFMEFLGINGVPFARVFTKTDKVGSSVLKKSIGLYDDKMLAKWESLPVTFVTSARKKTGRDEILGYIEESFNKFSKRD
jgi:GTP-binding protein